MLTIAIPTFNRNKEVVETIKAVLPQLNDSCNLLVIDNASTEPVSESLKKSNIDLDKLPYATLMCNRTNVGAQANLLRCIEYCETEWLWILGDDDIPNPDATSVILMDLDSHNDFTFFNYCSPVHSRDSTKITSGISEFLNAFEDWPQINFTSLCILNARHIKPFLRIGFLYAYSWSCINSCLFSCLVEKGGRSLFSEKIILKEIDNAEDDNKWIPLGPHFGKNILLELLPDNKDKKVLAKKMNNKPSLEYIVCLLLNLISTTGNKKHYIFIYINLINRVYYFERNIFLRIKLILYYEILYFPQIGTKLVNYILKKGKKQISVNVNQFDRT